MGQKRALVVYYSRTGNTRRVAEAIADLMKCDTEEVVDTKSRRGLLGFVAAGKDARLKRLTVIEPTKKDPASYDLVVIGTPVWAWTMSCAIRTYITQHRDRLPDVAFFLTTGGSGIERTFRHMEQLCGKTPLARLALTAKQIRKGDFMDQLKQFVADISR